MAQCKRCGLRKARFLSDLCNQCIDEPEPSPKREVPQVGKPQAPEQLKRLDALEELGGCIYYLLS